MVEVEKVVEVERIVEIEKVIEVEKEVERVVEVREQRGLATVSLLGSGSTLNLIRSVDGGVERRWRWKRRWR